MLKRKWIFLSNTFYASTRESIKKALSLAQDHLAKLTANESDAAIATLKANYLLAHNSFVAAYNLLQSKLGLYKGKTQSTEEALEELSQVKINEWRAQVFGVFYEGTSDATAIFPRERRPFQQGTYEQRIEAVATLYTTLATYTAQPTLVTLSSNVQLYYNNLLAVRALQQNDEGSTDTLRENLRLAHINLCNALYSSLGGLMQKYAANTEAITDYFDLTLLRKSNLKVLQKFEGVLNASAVLNIGEIVAKAKLVRVTVINGGPFEAGFTEDGINYNGNTVTLAGPGSEEVDKEDFNTIGNSMLLRNQNGGAVCSYKVEILG